MIKNIEKKLKEWSKAYYDGNPIVSDDIYDSVENFYQQLKGDFDPFEVRENNFRKTVKHWSRLTSLKKTYNYDDIIEKLGDNEIIIQPKLDGLSVSLQYIDGEFYKAVTRGDGIKGNDVTHIIKPYFEKYHPENLKLNKNITVQIRGEFIIPYEYEKYFIDKGYKSIRNVASGLINKKEFNDDVKYCDFIVHDIYFVENNEKYNDILFLNLKFIEDNNFLYAQDLSGLFKTLKMPSKPSSFVEAMNDTKMLKIWNYGGKTYVIDGYVFKLRYKTFELDKQGYPKDAIALKSEDRVNTTTTIKGIKWGMPNDKVVPKYILEPVVMDGSIVQYATAHNYGNIKNMIGKLKKGNLVTIIKAGDIIPQVKDIIDYGDGDDILSENMIPEKCPICGDELIKESVHLWCKNPNCKKKKIYRIIKLIDILEIKNIGKETVKALVNKYDFGNFKDIYESSAEQWENVDGLGKKAWKNFKKSADEKLNNFGIDELLISLAIPLHSNKTIKSFREIWKDDSVKSLFEKRFELSKIEGYTEYKFKIFASNLKKLKTDFVALKSLIRKKYEEKEKIDVKMNIMVTGKYEELSRKELKKVLEENGYEMVTSISKADILLCADINSKSSKMKKAKDKGIEIKTYEEFLNKI